MLSISLVELVNALQTFEQRKIMRDEGHVEDALLTKSLNRKRNMLGNKSENHSLCHYCKKPNHSQYKCWWRLDVNYNKWIMQKTKRY